MICHINWALADQGVNYRYIIITTFFGNIRVTHSFKNNSFRLENNRKFLIKCRDSDHDDRDGLGVCFLLRVQSLKK